MHANGHPVTPSMHVVVMLALSSQESLALLPTSLSFRFCRHDHSACLLATSSFLLCAACLQAQKGGGGHSRRGLPRLLTRRAAIRLPQSSRTSKIAFNKARALPCSKHLKTAMVATLPHVWKKRKPPYSCSQGWLMYVDMSMLEWVDQTQMAPEAGVVDAAQKDNVETSYRLEEFTFAAIVQYFEQSRLASKIWQHV